MFRGTVVHGDKLGRAFGYRTANLDISIKETKCKSGVYAAQATLLRKKYKSALIINSARDKVEVHLFQYKGPEFYGKVMTVDPIQKVSEIEKHDNEADLKAKIEDDITLVRKVLKL